MKKCPQCGIVQSGMDECQICGLIFEESKPRNEIKKPKIRSLNTKKIKYISVTFTVFLMAIVCLFIWQHFDKQKCRKAFLSLKKIDSFLSSGTSYLEYSKFVSYAKFEIDLLKSSSINEKKLHKIYECYETAKLLWNAEIHDDHKKIYTIVTYLNKTYDEFNLDIQKGIDGAKHSKEVVSSQKDGLKKLTASEVEDLRLQFENITELANVIHASERASKARRFLWAKASKMLKEYDN